MSLRFEVYYARKTEIEPDKNLLDKFGLSEIIPPPSGPFISFGYEDGSPEAYENSCLYYSGLIGEIIYFAIQENVGFFYYEHCKDGKLLRTLAYNHDGGWVKVDGEKEEWEDSLLFSGEKLEDLLSCYDQDEHAVINEAWERKQVREGDFFPNADGLELLSDLEKYFNLLSSEKYLQVREI